MQIRVVVLAQPDSERSGRLLAAEGSKVGLQAAGKRGKYTAEARQPCLSQGNVGVRVMASSLLRSYLIVTLGSWVGLF